MFGYKTAKEKAVEWNVSDRMVQMWCKEIEEKEFYVGLCVKEKYIKRELERQLSQKI